MHLNIKAACLSAFILPGLGQVVNGKKLKGIILIILVNIYILVALAVVLRAFGQLYLSAAASTPPDLLTVLEDVRRNNAGSRYLLAPFLLLWCYAVVDALFDHPKIETDD